MRIIAAIAKKEFKSYFVSPVAYVLITIFLILSNWLFFNMYFLDKEASMRVFIARMPWIFLFFVPAVTMRVWAEEKKMGTMEMLMTLPVKDYEAVIGKFLASFAFLAVCIALTISVPMTVSYTGDPDWGPIIGGYIGTILMGTAFLSLGLFISSLTENQIVAFILSLLVSFIFLIVGEHFVLYAIPNAIVPLFEYLGFGSHFMSISRGVIDSRDLIYYFSFIFFFLFLNVKSLESRKW
ncbi:MAG: ABC transporter [Candidatus Auribacter fodinae]|jgi:ABC-2 type transport system permease protein|uniref:ABC transporter n=1 Tax=Candidatus Auribacter fodinae TaxID=2093366 RepID=A0A3A4R595_9BACT|nr:MAG: ABC transporter [Candidatus Auribacter fodinae]